MRRFTTTVVAAAVLSAGAAFATQADAAMSDGALGARQALAQRGPLERVQFFFGGRNFCWYLNGWRGPGWYWCGYAWRSGYGWGGGYGWNGWRQPRWNGGSRRRPGGDWRRHDGGGSNAPHTGAIPHIGAGPAVRGPIGGHGPAGGHGAKGRPLPQ